MEINAILSQLKEERDRLNTAIGALEVVGTGAPRKTGKRKRVMSAEARAKIAAAARKRWAAAKKKGKTTLAA
ncbi:hypothetical protein [Candidatus Korobacter versatilis]|uniref:hypothetical protein n=1 Tax=Candidatus Korobacter versatilis TaxID=658062 RepID=UPI00030B03DD|nr:hypothetical protein [Candidatus Koribacter versatilis]